MSDKSSSLDSGGRHSRYVSVALPALIFLLLTLTILPTPILAHPPAEMKLEYNFDEQTLSVTITHSVSTPESHYVKKLEIKKNADLYLTRDYTSQPTTSTFTYTYDVTVGDGDVLEATAYCSLYGSKTERITVAAPSPVYSPSPTAPLIPLPTAPPSPSPTPASTPGFDVLFALSGVLAAIYLIKRRV